MERFFEDFKVGDRFRSGTATMTAERIKTFAAEFDPQPFHVDEAAARASVFGRLVASGWHTAAVTMRLIVESDLRLSGGIVGVSSEESRWPRPVLPGDVLRVEGEIVELRTSRSRPEVGFMKTRITTFNQAGEEVQMFTPTLMVRRRGS